MKQTTFSKKVCAEIERFFKEEQMDGPVIFHNELELQMLLCQHLIKKFNVPTSIGAFPSTVICPPFRMSMSGLPFIRRLLVSNSEVAIFQYSTSSPSSKWVNCCQ